MEVTLGGERLGAGKRQKIWMKDYERSTHDLGYIWRSTMSAGTLVPFMSEVALPGDTFDINLDVDVLTHPTTGPLFGSYKIQLDVFQIPIRLYQAMLHMNALGIGMDMSQVLLPLITIYGHNPVITKPIDNQQINASSILKYLGMSGIGYKTGVAAGALTLRQFNALAYLMYFDIYKQYYANKQEEVGMMIHHDPTEYVDPGLLTAVIDGTSADGNIPVGAAALVWKNYQFTEQAYLVITANDINAGIDVSNFRAWVRNTNNVESIIPLTAIFEEWYINENANQITFNNQY